MNKIYCSKSSGTAPQFTSIRKTKETWPSGPNRHRTRICKMTSLAPWIFTWLSYPVLISTAVACPLMLLSSGLSVLLSTYLTLTLTATAVTFLEVSNPARAAWKPTGTDIRNDVVYMVIVQMILPKAIVFFVLIGVARMTHGHGLGSTQLWPIDWSVPLQALLMLLVADFSRYWLHRAAHRNHLLWAFHAVHHAPRLLYWLNVGRFHPVDKALQLCVDSLPFVVLGVAEPALALYFTFYATNGFLQHSNTRLLHGPLNYVFSTAELHRWHHARDSNLAKCNFGNNLIIWDLFFGTRCLPKVRQTSPIGIDDYSYPKDFIGQLIAPFKKLAKFRNELESDVLARSKYHQKRCLR